MSPPLFLPLLLVVLSPDPGVHVLAASSSGCIKPDKVVHQSEVARIQTIETVKPAVINTTVMLTVINTTVMPPVINTTVYVMPAVIDTTVYVMPEPGFDGVTLETEDAEGQHQLRWFNLSEQCLASNNTWYELKAHVSVIDKHPDYNLRFRVDIDKCSTGCTIRGSADNVRKMIVVAHGPSKWKVTRPPSSCSVKLATSMTLYRWFCQLPPSPNLTIDTNTKINKFIIIVSTVVPVLAVALVVTTVLVVVMMKRARRGESSRLDDARSPTQPADPTVRHYVDGYIYYATANCPPQTQDTEPPVYDTLYAYGVVAPPTYENWNANHKVTPTHGGVFPRGTDSRLYENWNANHNVTPIHKGSVTTSQ